MTYTNQPAHGTYIKIGKMVEFRITVSLTSVTNFGSGQYFLTLPFPAAYDTALRQGGLHVGANHYSVMADTDPGSNLVDLWYNGSNGQDLPMDQNSPHALTTTDFFYISGVYECQ